MSKHETWRTRKYWGNVGGLLIEEFVAINGTQNQGRRLIDGVIVLNEKNSIYSGNNYNLEGKDVIVIQTKSSRIGMNLLGQAYFSRLLIQMHNPKSVKSVAICSRNDAIMERLAKKHNVEIVVIPDIEEL